MQIHIALEDQHKTTFTCPFGTLRTLACHLAYVMLQELKSRLTSAPILQAPNWDLPFELMFSQAQSPSEAQAESLSARPRLEPCREPSQVDPGGTPRQQSEPPGVQLSSTSLPGVACNASHSKGRIGIVHNSERIGAFGIQTFSRPFISNYPRFLLLRSRWYTVLLMAFLSIEEMQVRTEKLKLHSNAPLFTAFKSETEIVPLCRVCRHLTETKPDRLC
ncbi:hypothetical protein CR513_44159, partial [Mucuna pruriens]